MAKKRGKKKSSKKKVKRAKKKVVMEDEEEMEATASSPSFEAKKGKGLVAIPILGFLLFLWFIALRLDLYPPFYFNTNDEVPFGIVFFFEIFLILLLAIAYSSKARRVSERLELDEEALEEYRKHEEEIGSDHKGSGVGGEELTEVEPDYLEVEVIDEEDAEDGEPAPASTSTKKEWGVIEYPPQITGGVYSDTLIPTGRGTILKLRTIIARACLICDKQVDCWPKSRRHISKDDFIFNTECKGGLRRLGVEDI